MKRNVFKNIIDKSDLDIYLYFEGLSNIEPNDMYPIIEETLNNITKNTTYEELLNIIRKLFKDYIEEELILNYNRKNEIYSSSYINGELNEMHITKQMGNDMEIMYEYIKEIGTSYHINITTNTNIDLVSNYLIDEVPTKIKTIKKKNKSN